MDNLLDLYWNDYKENACNSFKSCYQDQDFANVTLAITRQQLPATSQDINHIIIFPQNVNNSYVVDPLCQKGSGNSKKRRDRTN